MTLKTHWLTNTDRSIPTNDDLYYKCEDSSPLIEAAKSLRSVIHTFAEQQRQAAFDGYSLSRMMPVQTVVERAEGVVRALEDLDK